MRIIVILSILLLAGSSYSQDSAPDSADTVYVPLDSLDAGIDLASRALKLKRSDLTFRGDYLEPDEYRISAIDSVMLKPLKLIGMAERKLKTKMHYFHEFAGPRLMEFDKNTDHPIDLHGHLDIKLNREDSLMHQNLKELAGPKIYDFLENAYDFSSYLDIRNRNTTALSDLAIRDSLIEGFTLILEEDVEDEFKSVEEIDSLSLIEEEWAEAMVELAIELEFFNRDYQKFLDAFWVPIWFSGKVEIPSSSYGSTINSDHGQIIIGDTTDNHYTGDLFIVIDPGGNDTYDIEFEGTGHHTYIIDYGGDDTYNMPQNRVSPYFFGSNMIIDYDGNDLYNAGSWTLGAGLFGVGVLWDMKGNDRYYGDTFTMGAGCFGVGILRDDEGNDSYQAALFSQGFGFVDGVGVLIDNAGNDNYFAGGKYKDFIRYDDHYLSLSQGFGYGLRPKMSGGVGMLIDKSGNDVYVSDIFGQGASYWYSLGMLADGGGNDQYISFQYAQGNGTHMSLGILYDVEGDDVYSAKGVSQGCGHDRATGLLIDLDGDDNYNAYDLCQGAGSANGLGLIADVRGKDVYIVRSNRNTQGYGNPRREYGSIGIFLDLSGEDNYSGGLGRDNHWWTYSMWGAGLDK
jgi:hypothetical protein